MPGFNKQKHSATGSFEESNYVSSFKTNYFKVIISFILTCPGLCKLRKVNVFNTFIVKRRRLH